jgi:excisionase family DNA binding protein
MACSERQVRRLMYRGDLPFTHVGGLSRLLIEDLDAYLDANRETHRGAA